MRAGTTCIGQSGGGEHCLSTTFRSGLNPAVLAFNLLASAVFSLTPLILRRVARVLWAWGGLIVALFVLSFGLDIRLLPAAGAALVASQTGANQPAADAGS